MNPGYKIQNRNLAGVVYILAGVGFLSSMDSVAKMLVGADYSVIQILAVRGWIIVTALMLVLPRLGGFDALKTTQPVKHLLRVLVGVAAPYFFFSSLKEMGLADATVIFFGAGTFLMTALSGLLFKEPIGPHRWGAVAVGFVGVLIAARPSGGVFQIEALYALASGASYALLALATRWLGPSEGTFRPVFYYNIGLALLASAGLPFVFKSMPTGDMTTILLMASLAITGHFFVTRAFHTASLSLLAPFEYTSLIWAALLGYFFWADIPSTNVLVGAGIIISSGMYLIHRETLAARRLKRENNVVLASDPMIITVPVPGEDIK
jgi:drug/metabolite transporter (DMT)-like permease